ncbi:hypothetical protein PV05_11308 [Exophiala xenobiotica]|uniref:Uncharacterized protein n=1 Tax=Exophiala xenobiotica TaxID=348802 RepID=A0A0D2CIF5_9EURO|nr:uncharacterized protein PV05_11308 [Exophiala xenobiotica]KIW49647.1 hypothetical protein PV05_11308 [Exophiala xenobiotica]
MPSPPTESEILHSYLLHPSPLPTILPYTSFQSLLPKTHSSHNARQQHHPDLKLLYRSLQYQRDITLDDIRRRIEDECRRSKTLTARLARQVRREEQSNRPDLAARSRKRKRSCSQPINDDDHNHSPNNNDDDHSSSPSSPSSQDENEYGHQISLQIDTHLHGLLGSTLPAANTRNNHSTQSLLFAMERAKHDLESEITSLEAQIATIHAECEETVGSLSDLRYGRFAQNRISGQSVDESAKEAPIGGVERDVIDALGELRARLLPT